MPAHKNDVLGMTPEEKARVEIDRILTSCGWTVQDKNAVNLAASRGVAVAELSFKKGEPDYTLFVDGKAIGTVEAKPEGFPLTGVEEQSEKYVTGTPHGLPHWGNPLPCKIKVLCVPLPPLAEQKPIVEEVERRLSVVEELSALVAADLQRAIRLRQAILQRAFTGELA